MTRWWVLILTLLALTAAAPVTADAHGIGEAKIVEVRGGSVTLHALLWRPQGRGPFPAVLFNHGSGRTPEDLARLGPYEAQADIVGPVFARHGYEFLYLFRRGVGLSADQGASAIDLMTGELAVHGQEARNTLQLQLMENREMTDALSGLAYLRSLPDVDARRVAVVGHSFGGSMTVLLAAREPDLRAVVVFSGAGLSWDRSAELRARLLTAAPHIEAPVFLVHAANDYSLSAARALDARLTELGKPHLSKIYPPIGHTAEDGHSFVYLGVSRWEPDVFAFLDEHMRK